MLTLADLLGDQPDEAIDIPGTIMTRDMPIKAPEKLDWAYRQDPRRLTKMFKFSDESKYNAFVIDLLEHQSESGHHGRITLQYPQVKIEVWTHSLDDVTDIDVEWAVSVNEIYGGYHGQK